MSSAGIWAEELDNGIRPYQQALVTVLCRHLGLAQPDDDLHRLAFAIVSQGVFLYVGRDVIQAIRPQLINSPDAIDAWVAGFATHAPGGGESLAQMLHRVAAALQTAREWRAHQGTKDVVWITHAGVARCVAWLQARGESVLPRSEDWPVAAPGWGEWEIRELA